MSQGIFGIDDYNKPIDNSDRLAVAMGKFLQKDGYREAKISYECDNYYILGMKRICEASFQQTAIAQNDAVQSLCLIHGEIHNFQEVLKEHLDVGAHCEGDLDLALQLYNRYGPQFAQKLNGLFSLAILDQKDQSLTLLNDRFGMAHQVYWTAISSRLYFATHLKTLLECPELRKELDVEALNLFLKYSYIPSPWTIFKNIQKLQPGHRLVFKDGQVTIEPYWEFGINGKSVSDLQEAVSVYKRLLKESISKRLGNNDTVGILLSGGLDSSANVAIAAQCTDKKLKTFSIGFEDPAFDERPYARIVARHFNTKHFEYTVNGMELEHLPYLVWNMEEPYFEFGLFLTYMGMTAAQKEVDAVIGGEGADQLFGTGGFVGGLPVALRYILLKYRLIGLARNGQKVARGSYFYDHDNLAFKLRLLLNRVVDLND